MNQGLQGELRAVMPQALSTGLFTSLATVYGRSRMQGPTGNFTDAYSPVVGLSNIPCMDAPPSMARVQATEVAAVEEIMSVGLRHCLLNRCFLDASTWSDRGYRVSVDGTIYNLLGAENDSQLQETRMDLKLVKL